MAPATLRRHNGWEIRNAEGLYWHDDQGWISVGMRWSGFSRRFMRRKAREVGGKLVQMTLVRRVKVGKGAVRCADCASREAEARGGWKYIIEHPSERMLCSVVGEESWGFDDPILFDTVEEAKARVDERAKQYPKGDWPQARVRMFRPGRRIPDEWKELP